MSNIYVLYWTPGSCGDIVQTLICHDQGLHSGFEFGIDEQGRAWRKITDQWNLLFPHNQPHLTNSSATDHGWLQRQWSKQDCDTLLELSQSRSIIIGTHSLDQLEFIKQQLGSQVQTIGVTYGQNLHKFVIKNYCSKILNRDSINKTFVADYDPKLAQILEKNDAVGIWSLKNELAIHRQVPVSVKANFDINIDLAKFLAGDLQWATQYVQSKEIYDQWIQRQNPLFTHRMPVIYHYDQCMGKNPFAKNTPNHPITLDLYDKIFVSFYCKHHQYPEPKVNTLAELFDFFETLPR